MAGIGAFYLLSDKHVPHAKKFLQVATRFRSHARA